MSEGNLVHREPKLSRNLQKTPHQLLHIQRIINEPFGHWSSRGVVLPTSFSEIQINYQLSHHSMINELDMMEFNQKNPVEICWSLTSVSVPDAETLASLASSPPLDLELLKG